MFNFIKTLQNIDKNTKDCLSLNRLMVNMLQEVPTAPVTKTLADYAEDFIGIDASPRDVAPDELGCAESVSEIIQEMFPDFEMQTATWILKSQLDKDKRFERVTTAKRGDIIMSPTIGGQFIGHTGIFSEPEEIMSNSSYTGTWENNFTLNEWVARYRTLGGLKIYYYRVIRG